MNGRTAVALASAACGVACSLFLDTGEFTNEGATASDAGPNDSATPAIDAPANATDTGADGTATVDSGGGGCPDGAFCDSFERTALVGPWGGLIDNAKGCTLAIDGTVGHVGSSSLKMFIPQKTEDDCQAFLHRDFGGAPKKFRMSFSIRVSAELVREVHLVDYEVSSPTRGLYFTSFNGGLELAEQRFGTDGFFDATPIGGLEPGKWHRVVLDHDVATRNTTVTLDGQPRLTAQTAVSFAAPAYRFLVGNFFSRAGAANDVWFDDVRLEPEF